MIMADNFQQVVTAADELISGILWVRQDGPMKAVAWAYSGRKQLLALRPVDFLGEERRRFLRFRKAVRDATKGSCLRWDADAIDKALSVIRHPDSQAPVITPGPSGASAQPVVKERFAIVLREFQAAEEAFGRELTDREAHDLLKEYRPHERSLPGFATWQRYLREARRLTGQNKNHSRHGWEGRSIVSVRDIENPRAVVD
ncbi:MAG: hypothetical protein L0Y70_26085 [Gemmataceae bacterium]|nr:hypothetical protein [Gemmataceae bacterium]